MNLRDLKYLVALAEHRHFGRAADACFVSQPTLSTQLKKLEETLGVTLIERNRRRLILTPVGETIVAQAGTVLRSVDQLLRLADEHRDPLGGDFRSGHHSHGGALFAAAWCSRRCGGPCRSCGCRSPKAKPRASRGCCRPGSSMR